MSNVTDLTPKQVQLLRRVAAEGRFKTWVFVGVADDGEYEFIPDGEIGPNQSINLLIEGLVMVKDQWADETPEAS